MTLSRHGSRAPNPVARALCPANAANLDAYKVPAEQLTEVGMSQLLAVGKHVQDEYMTRARFLSPSLNGVNHSHFETYFRADAATRCSQSATALALGLYPDGTGPGGFGHQPVPVTMQLLQNEHAFAAPKGPCKAVLQKDLAVYAKKRAPELFAQYEAELKLMGEICGVEVEDYPTTPGGEDKVLGVKDVADMFVFDHDEQLPLTPGLTAELRASVEQLAFTNLMERYYSTDREITYWVGGFADLLLGNLNGAATPVSPSIKDYRFYSYHGHRELLHGLGKMLGWDFDFEGLPRAMGTTSLHPGTTMFFELRARQSAEPSANEPTEEYFVRTFVWSPYTSREQIKLDKCSAIDCPLSEFNDIIRSHTAKTGTWEKICDYRPPVQELSQDDDGLDFPSGYILAATVALSLVFAIYKAVGAIIKHRRRNYMPL